MGALIAMMRHFGWQRVTVLNTDTQYAKDMVNEFRRIWFGELGNKVGYSDTIRLDSTGGVDETILKDVFDGIPNDPAVNSRVIFLAAHTQHFYSIVKYATETGFQPDTIWVWGGREDVSESYDLTWLPEIPGYLGVSPYRNRDEVYMSFMNHFHAYRRARGREALDELPAFAAETVDSIRALAWAIVNAKDRRNGLEIVQALQHHSFSGVSGYVEFDEIGDRKNAKFSLFNARRATSNGESIEWHEIGYTDPIGTKNGGTVIPEGIEGVCFAQGCGLSSAPEDRYPEDPVTLPPGIIALIVILGSLFLLATLKYWRSHRSKRISKQSWKHFVIRL